MGRPVELVVGKKYVVKFYQNIDGSERIKIYKILRKTRRRISVFIVSADRRNVFKMPIGDFRSYDPQPFQPPQSNQGI